MSEKKNGLSFFRIHKRWVAAVMVFVVVILAVVMQGHMRKAASQTGSQDKNRIQTAEVKKMDLSTSISVTGTIASGDSRSVSTSVAGVEVKEVKAAVGDYVNAGDTILTLDSSSLEEELEIVRDDYNLSVARTNQSLEKVAENITDAERAYTEGVENQRDLVADAKALYDEALDREEALKKDYEAAQKNTEKAQNAYRKIKEEKSALKKALDKAEEINIEAAETLEKFRQQYEAAQATAKDVNGNVDSQVYQNYIDARNRANTAQAEYDKARAAYDKIEQEKSSYTDAKKVEEEAKNAYDAAVRETFARYAQYEQSVDDQDKTNERNAEAVDESQDNYSITSQEAANNLKSQKRQVQNAKEKLGECVVTSPINGVITSLSLEAGDIYEGGEVFVVQDMTTLIVEAFVDEYDISSIDRDMSAVIKTDATGDEELKGTVTFVAPTPESSQIEGSSNSGMTGSSGSATYRVQITLADANENLRVGMTAKTSIISESVRDVLAVPYDYVQTDEDGNRYVEVAYEQGIVSDSTTKVQVETGMESDYYIEVSSDELKEGMRVIVSMESLEAPNDSKEAVEQMPFVDIQNDRVPGGHENKGGGMPSGGGPGGF